LDLGNGTQFRNPAIHLVRVVADGMPLRRGEDDEQLIEGSEALKESTERAGRLAMARQKTQDVGVE
jgi:hypothetical protein